MSDKSKNVFTDTGSVVAVEGVHTATVISTEYVGKVNTKYGPKEFQMFVLRVKQYDPTTSKPQTADIHQQFHRSFDPKATMTQFLAAFGIEAHAGMTFDFDDLVGHKLQIVVTHTKDARGRIHANVRPLKKTGGAQ